MSQMKEEAAARKPPPSDTLNVALIGLGSMGNANMRTTGRTDAKIVALCDVDEAQTNRIHKYAPEATVYTDYRRLLEKEKGVDAVIISTPNHTHAVISIAAMQLGKHVYCEKPLAHTVYELRKMNEVAEACNVATQLGNQGHSYETNREHYECVRSGAIGEVREVHMVEGAFNYSQIPNIARLKEDHPVPDTLDWDLWLGPVPHRKYNPSFHPGSWRSWRSFSSGMIGDFICHVVDPVFWALELGAPTLIEAEAAGYDPRQHSETFPQSSKIRFEFPARGQRPALTMYWYDGDRYTPPRPEELADTEEFIPIMGPGPTGGLVIGDKGKILYGSHGATEWRIVSESKMKEYMAGRTKAPDPRGPGMPDNLAHHIEWHEACKGGAPTRSGFDYGGRLTEIALIGDIAQRMPGTELQWDSRHMTFPNHPEANAFLHYRYRDGWTL
ncbi:MAG: Gfo/Idh/MocA family oxidoreductase [Desulfobacterales bacterium]